MWDYDKVYDNLWSGFPKERLEQALRVDDKNKSKIISMLKDGCPEEHWPFGCSTPVNPWIVFLGPSPGDSPAKGDTNYITRKGDTPTFGKSGASMVYQDPRGFFDKIRYLAKEIITKDDPHSLAAEECLALAAMMNLDSGASGQAAKVQFNEPFSRWVLDVIFRRLKPRYIIGFGLRNILAEQKYSWLRDAFGKYLHGGTLNVNKPHKIIDFNGYTRKRFKYRIWRGAEGFYGRPTHFILFPQHPCRSPMTNWDIWKEATQEFIEIFANNPNL